VGGLLGFVAQEIDRGSVRVNGALVDPPSGHNALSYLMTRGQGCSVLERDSRHGLLRLPFDRNQQPLFLQAGQPAAADYSDDIAKEIDLEVRRILDRQYERTTSILKANAEKLHKAASVLLSKETITGEELAAIVTSASALHGDAQTRAAAVAASSK
jgi:hypothetical protein